MMESLLASISHNRVWYCLDCGKCSALCPITRWETESFSSPRLLVDMAIRGKADEIVEAPLLWACLMCKRCGDLCPADVDFQEFVLELRNLAREDGLKGACTHGDIFRTVGRMMTDPDLEQDRLAWLEDDCLVSEESDVVFFVGCLPYFAPVFDKLGLDVLNTARSAIRILNYLGITPQVLADERCCGHDQRWQGDLETFRYLAEFNIELFKRRGARRIITACPECSNTLKNDYLGFSKDIRFDVIHITEFITESELFTKSLEFGLSDEPNNSQRVTYQDPCRLGRHQGIYDSPRKIISNLGLDLLEMERSRKRSLCCGTSCWTACGQVNKKIQVERLEEAKAAGADLLITACIKCQIHFKCAQVDPCLSKEIDIELRDLISLVADRLPLVENGMVQDE